MNVVWIVFLLVGLLITFLAYLIKYKKQAHLISGYYESLLVDKDCICNWIGSIFMYYGIFVIISSLLLWQFHINDIIFIVTFIISILTACITAIAGSKKYKKQD